MDSFGHLMARYSLSKASEKPKFSFMELVLILRECIMRQFILSDALRDPIAIVDSAIVSLTAAHACQIFRLNVNYHQSLARSRSNIISQQTAAYESSQ